MSSAECVVPGCVGHHHARGFCNKHYERWRRHGDPLRETTPGERFWAKVDRSGGPDACWPWTAHTLRGYGRFGVGHRHIEYAHRFAYELANGPIPEGLDVCHSCDNPPCCNERHLFLGTRAMNVADMDAKGRRRSRALPGEGNPRAKLTAEAVREIRRRADGGESGVSLAGSFGVSANVVSRILSRKMWKSVP